MAKRKFLIEQSVESILLDEVPTTEEIEPLRRYKTNDFYQFKFIGGNRDIKEEIVRKKQRVLREIGVKDYLPVLVDEDFRVLDGQHYVVACQRNYQEGDRNQVLIYSIIPRVEVAPSVAASINSNSTRWTLGDYVNSWTVFGKCNFKWFQDFIEEYKLTETVAAMICSSSRYSFTDKLKKGVIDLTDDQKLQAVKLAGYINEWAAVRQLTYRQGIVVAGIKALETVQGYDNSFAVQKMVDLPRFVRNPGSIVDFLQIVEGVYNFKTPASKQVKLDLLIARFSSRQRRHLMSHKGVV